MNEELLQLVYSNLQTDASFDEFKATVFEDTLNIPNSKGVNAEQNGGLDSRSANTNSSLELDQADPLQRFQDSMLRHTNPELFKRKKELEENVSGQSKVINFKDKEELDEINSQIESMRNYKPKSLRKRLQENSDKIEKELFDVVEKAETSSKSRGMTTKEILSQNENKYLVDEWIKLQKDIDEENKILKKATNDVTLTEQFGSFITFGLYKPDKEQLELSEEIEEQILLNLENTDTKKQLAFGSEDRTFTSLQKREELIQKAKQDVYVREYNKAIDEINENNTLLSHLNEEDEDILVENLLEK